MSAPCQSRHRHTPREGKGPGTSESTTAPRVRKWHILYRSQAHSAPGDLYWGRRSQIDLFGNSQGVVDLYSKVPHCAFPTSCAQAAAVPRVGSRSDDKLMLASCTAANACRISQGPGQASRSSVRPVWRTGEYVSGARHKCGSETESRRDEVRPHRSSEQPYPSSAR